MLSLTLIQTFLQSSAIDLKQSARDMNKISKADKYGQN
jgi:hypothetical protein